jgi:hypothetical protein
MNNLAVIYKTDESRFFANQKNGIETNLHPCCVIQITLADLMSQYRQQVSSIAVCTNKIKPCITREDLNRTDTKYVIIIDEGNKEAPTHDVFDTLFELYSAARSNNHILILHGELNCDYLKQHMEQRAGLSFWRDDYETTVTQLSDFWKWISGISEIESRGLN